ncbi:MAG: S9 family peptidase [Gemmatimonadetes bacterium]|nr:S9 family peptidase [Gemmatimonadota bacterium]
MKVELILRLAALAVAFPLGLCAAQETGRRPITHEDVWLMRRVGAPALSPDGRWAVFPVTEPAYDEREESSDLWIVPTDGSAGARRLTATRARESGVAWSPDGRRVAFAARREGDDISQIYVLDVAQGGEAQRVTDLSTGARAPRWRPDGRAILFTSDVYRGAATDSANRAIAAERRARTYNARVYDGFPIRHWDRWLDDRRPSLFVQPLEPGARARDLLAGTELAARPGFGGQLGNSAENLSAAWTPDGSGVVFAATANRNEAAFADVVQALWLVPATGGEPRRLTADSNSYGSPSFHPDGRALYATMEPTTDRVYNNNRLVMWSWPNPGATQPVAGGADRSVSEYDFAPDGRTVYFLSEDQGHVKLFRAPATGGETRELGQLTSGALGDLSIGGTAAATIIVTTWATGGSPPELVRWDAATGRITPLTRLNAARLAQLDLAPVRQFWFTSSRGLRIHNLLVVPAGFDSTRRYPLFVVIHGGPHSQWTDNWSLRWNYHLLASPGYVLLLTNYIGSTGFGERFAQGIQGDPLEGPGRDLDEAVDSAITRFSFIDRSRLVAGGASYGGHLTNWLAATTTRYRALVSHAGLWDLESQWGTSDVIYSRERNMGAPPWENGARWRAQSPLQRAANLRTPVLVSAGERDFRVPMNNALEFWSALQRMRVPSKLVIWPTENHWILNGEDSRFFYREVHAWLARWLADGASGASR